MTKKQKENLVSLTEVAVIFFSIKPAQRHMIWEIFRLFSYDQCEKILGIALRGQNEKKVVKKKRKYTRKKKAAKKSVKP